MKNKDEGIRIKDGSGRWTMEDGEGKKLVESWQHEGRHSRARYNLILVKPIITITLRERIKDGR